MVFRQDYSLFLGTGVRLKVDRDRWTKERSCVGCSISPVDSMYSNVITVDEGKTNVRTVLRSN